MTMFALHLAGAVALLLWSVGLVRTGVERGFMAQLRASLRRAAKRPVSAAMAGAASAVALQSSTAVAILVVTFAAAGSLVPPVGLAIMLGADVGSAVAAQILFAPVQDIVPILLLVGVVLFLRARTPAPKQFGRILIGLALVLVSLTMIREATGQLRDSVLVGMVAEYLSSDLIASFVLGAAFAWAMHSSIAAVLTVVTFAAQGVLPALPAAALVLGANIGGGLIPVTLTLTAPVAARRIVLANFAVRGGGAVLGLIILIALAPDLGLLGGTASRQAINLHLAYNIVLAVAGLLVLNPALRLMALLVREPAQPVDARVSSLDESALQTPDRALVCATRELLVMGERVHGMLVPALGLFRNWDPEVVEAIEKGEEEVDRLHFQIKLYVSRLQDTSLTGEQSQHALDLVTLANNLEDAGDQISSNLVEHARRMQTEGLSFSEDGWRDLTDFHDCVLSNAQLALNVLMTNDADSARQLVEEKDRIRQLEQTLQARHFARLRSRNPVSIETSNLHQETMRALKQINTAFSLVAYPIARETGDLLSSRLAGNAARAR
ncbi:Na/Pi cotransporter family protein [Frigidibacter sp. ROC022]|uniref:Na/Pi cotransporter family protein n=1 Tax=Frigidibacter sp. ROC022 TaxID=2971796 RepID=UPI00215B529F|nr:Na/Pi cotransporter family protein [Frigidibacter sp. ROC022]MCR8726646.1 Na/Pi cotransporter family protein [Frigidibacter sp. ROC022]